MLSKKVCMACINSHGRRLQAPPRLHSKGKPVMDGLQSAPWDDMDEFGWKNGSVECRSGNALQWCDWPIVSDPPEHCRYKVEHLLENQPC